MFRNKVCHRASKLSLNGVGVMAGPPAQASPVNPSINQNGLPKTGKVRPAKTSYSSTEEEDSLRTSTQSTQSVSLSPKQQQQQMLREAIFGDSLGTVGSKDMIRIEWPRNSIPRRIKKLSWEDDGTSTLVQDRDRAVSTLTDPNVRVTPMNIRTDQPHQVGKSVYF